MRQLVLLLVNDWVYYSPFRCFSLFLLHQSGGAIISSSNSSNSNSIVSHAHPAILHTVPFPLLWCPGNQIPRRQEVMPSVWQFQSTSSLPELAVINRVISHLVDQVLASLWNKISKRQPSFVGLLSVLG